MILGTAITLVWFIRDMRRENGKILKAIYDGQREQSKIFAHVSEILARIEEGQREGFRKLAEILSRVEQGQREWSKAMLDILARIEQNTRRS
jgi:hypothetical protein